MKDEPVFQESLAWGSSEGLESEVRRMAAKLRHFRGIAISVMDEALQLWEEIWTSLQDTRSCEEILSGDKPGLGPEFDRKHLMEKLHLLGTRIECARRLCEGSIGKGSQEQGDSRHG